MATLINIGVTGLTASQTALSTTGNNITNANTPGYSRQRVNLEALPEQYTGSGYIGAGVQVQGVSRVVEQFLIGQLRTNTANYNEADTLATQFERLDSLLADSSTGVAPALQNLFDSVQQASQDPTSVAVRQVVLSTAGSLTQRFSSLYGQLQDQKDNVSQQLTALTGQVSSLAQSIAKLNQDISDRAFSPGVQPNELLDNRDELLRQLSELVDVQVVDQHNGMLNIFVGSGQPLVVGNQANLLKTGAAIDDPSRTEVFFSNGIGSQAVGSLLTGGKIGGLIKYRDTNLANALNLLGRVALSFADSMNNQQKLGLDLNGNFGRSLFTDINSVAAQVTRVTPSGNNAPPADRVLGVFIDNAANLTDSDYKLTFSSATAYTLTRTSDGVAVASGALVGSAGTVNTTDGFRIDITSGSYTAGDSFLIQPTRQGARDIAVALQRPEELAFAQPISTDATLSNRGGGTISGGTVLSVYQSDGVTLQPTFATSNTLSPPLLVRFNSPATTYDILNNSIPGAPVAIAGLSGLAFTAGQTNTVTINDPVTGDPVYSFALAGNPAAGDQFTIKFNLNGSSDNRNALALAGLKLAKTIGGNLTYSDAYGQLVSSVGARTAELKINRDAADTLVAQAQTSRDSVSGVNLDEEAANLVRFEQAYNASAQVISIARSIFDTLLATFR